MREGHGDDGDQHTELVERARAGDADAFAALYDDIAPRLLGFLCHQVGSADLAEELMQRTFVKVIEGLPRYQVRRGVPFRAWVFRIARNVVIDEHRTRHPALDVDAMTIPASSVSDPEHALEAAVEREELHRAIDQLPSDEHDVIVYRFFAGLAPDEAAPLLHRSTGAVRVLQYRALRRLRTLLPGSTRTGLALGAQP